MCHRHGHQSGCRRVLLSCPPAPWVCVCIQPPSLLSCRMALREAAPAGSHTAGKAGASTVAVQHQTASPYGCCQKQMGPAPLFHGSRRTAGTFAPAAWPTHRSPARLQYLLFLQGQIKDVIIIITRDRPALSQVSGFQVWRVRTCPSASRDRPALSQVSCFQVWSPGLHYLRTAIPVDYL
jgi:hypothetical protein